MLKFPYPSAVGLSTGGRDNCTLYLRIGISM